MPESSVRPTRPPGILPWLTGQEARYLAVGMLNAVFSISVYAGAHALLGDDVSYVALLVPTYALGIVFSFVTQRYLVFQVHGQFWTDLVRFTLVQLAALGLNAVALPLVRETTHLPVVVSQVIALGIVVVITYFSHVHFSFRRHKPVHETLHELLNEPVEEPLDGDAR